MHSIIAIPRINLYHTDWIDETISEKNKTQQHHCLRVATKFLNPDLDREMILYCLSESSSNFNITIETHFPKYHFTDLTKANITSQDLYLWSAPMDLIERYQAYLDALSISNPVSSERDVFYNCTWPRFGPRCQYQFDDRRLDYSSLDDLIHGMFNSRHEYSTIFPCYEHLPCDRGPSPSCLDWSEICDGKVDCFNGGIDEKDCWQMEIHECEENEYRCMNGQCISEFFFRDQQQVFDCVDKSDGVAIHMSDDPHLCSRKPASLACDDVLCNYKYQAGLCQDDRRLYFWESMYSVKDEEIREECWSALKCLLGINRFQYLFCSSLCANNRCLELIDDACPDMLYFPNVPIFFGDIYLAFRKENLLEWKNHENQISYLCSKNSRYHPFLNTTTITSVTFNGSTCFYAENIYLIKSGFSMWNLAYEASLLPIYNGLKSYYRIFNYNTTICNRRNMYQCRNTSVCISIHRLLDRRYDCPYFDDENITFVDNDTAIQLLRHSHCKGQLSGKYIHWFFANSWDCLNENPLMKLYLSRFMGLIDFHESIAFEVICDGFVDLTPLEIDGKNETDETECDRWECDNVYTYCNNEWNCPNGVDEIDCPWVPLVSCSINERICVSSQTNEFMCLPSTKFDDGKIDCLGGTDESKQCPYISSDDMKERTFHCIRHSAPHCIDRYQLCNGHDDCDHGDDEQFCQTNRTDEFNNICIAVFIYIATDVERFFCIRPDLRRTAPSKNVESLFSYHTENRTDLRSSSLSNSRILSDQTTGNTRYSRGLDLHIWLNQTHKSTAKISLCPPSFYGSRCQYQNQRIALTLQFRASSDSWRTLFAMIISLIDDSDQRLTHSFEQITFLWSKNCQTKFHFYLLYSTRPKDLTKNYSIHIDFYEKLSFAYRGSVRLPVHFPFLPVQRQPFLVDIPRREEKRSSCLDLQCHHGRCTTYLDNTERIPFCRCDREWFGQYCHLSYHCTCSSDSLCLGMDHHNRSICLCPPNRFGPRCLLIDRICDPSNSSMCENGGRCIPSDNYSPANQSFLCICREGYTGDRCEVVDSKLILSFDRNIRVSQKIFIHFFYFPHAKHQIRSATFQLLLFKQDSLVVNWSKPFHLALIELNKNDYYLIYRQRSYHQSLVVEKTIQSSDRCPHITEFFNKSFSQLHQLRRMKYYQIPCQQSLSSNLSCFYDDQHLCLCYLFHGKRLANCFPFDYQMKFDCYGKNECENNGECFQDSPTCPRRSICRCPSCFHGRRCQLTTSGFGLSLDAILGYHIIPNVGVGDQSAIVQFSLAMTILFIIIGLVDSSVSLMTFKNKSMRQVGCGLYLLGSSITTLLTTMMFGLKFFILLLTQMNIISSQRFLQVQCMSVDFLVRVCLSFDQWLNACVAIERTITIMKGVNFDTKKSRRAAKFIMIILLLIVVGSCIHDPFYRRVLDDDVGEDDEVNMKRTWCIVRYTPIWQQYNSFMHTFHFSGPFVINLISSILLITQKTHQQLLVHNHRSYKSVLREQCQLHKHLLAAPVVSVILGLPRLIIASVSKCMESNDESWLYLIGYFISFLPSMLTSVIYIVPSEFYKKKFSKTVVQLRRRFASIF